MPPVEADVTGGFESNLAEKFVDEQTEPRAELIRAIVIDNGSRTCRAGFAGDAAPSVVFPSIVSKAKPFKKTESDGEDVLSSDSDREDDGPIIGDEAFKRRHKDIYTSPISDGVVTNWDDLEAIWRYTFTEKLEVHAQDHPVFLMEPLLNPKAARAHMTQLIFETFDAPALHITSQATMALFASGLSTGVVLDSGTGLSSAVPVYELYSIPHAIQRCPLAGRQLDKHLLSLLMDRGLTFELHQHRKRNVARVTQAKIKRQNSIGGTPNDEGTRVWGVARDGGSKDQLPKARTRASIATVKSSQTLRTLQTQGTLVALPDGTKAPRRSPVSRAELERNGKVVTISRNGKQQGKLSQPLNTFKEGEEKSIPEAVAEIIRRIKEETAYVALDLATEVNRARQTKDIETVCELIVGSETITVNEERFRCGEALFEPYVLVKEGIQTKGIQYAVADAVAQCASDIQTELWSGVVLCGGTMMLPGVVERMDKELRMMYPERSMLNIVRGESCSNAAWSGASKFAAQESFLRLCVTRGEFDDAGPEIAGPKFSA